MRVLFTIKSVSGPGGGAERVLRDVACGLAGRDHEVRVASFDDPAATPFYDYPASVGREPLGVGDPQAATSRLEGYRRLRALRRLLARTRPDAAVGFMHSSYVLLAVAATGLRVPVVASEHNAVDNYRSRPLQRTLLYASQALVEHTSVLSERVAAGYAWPLRRRAVVLPDPVTATDRRADVHGHDRASRLLLAVGSLTDQKDHATLVRAFAVLRGRFPGWRLRIVGEGPLRTRLEQLVDDLGVADVVELPGASDRIGDEYAAAQLFATPSRYEGFGLVTAEALAHGLPCVGFVDCAGTNELITDGVNGLLVPSGPDRAEELAAGLAMLMEDDERRGRLARAAPASVARFGLEATLDRWEELLTVVSGSRTRRGAAARRRRRRP